MYVLNVENAHMLVDNNAHLKMRSVESVNNAIICVKLLNSEF